jgi:hypothetical protein
MLISRKFPVCRIGRGRPSQALQSEGPEVERSLTIRVKTQRRSWGTI